MAKLSIHAGDTSRAIRLFIQDSTSTTGGGLTGLVFNSPSLTAYYIRQGSSSPTAVTLVTATVGTWTSSGFKEVDATNMPGVYEFGIPDAAIAVSAKHVLFYFKGATNMVPLLAELELDAVDYQDSVRFGLTALPNAAAGANGGLPTGNASGQVALQTGTGAGQLDFTSGVVKADLRQILGTALTETAGLLAGGFKKLFNVTTPTGTLNSIPGAVPGAAGGLFIAGTNAVATGISGDVQTGMTAQGYTAPRGPYLDALRGLVSHQGTAQGGASSSITLAAGASAVDNRYRGALVSIDSGTGANQPGRIITAYNGTTKVATLDRAWITNPDATSVYTVWAISGPALNALLAVAASSVSEDVAGKVLGGGSGTISGTGVRADLSSGALDDMADSLLDETASDHNTAGSVGNQINRIGVVTTNYTGPQIRGSSFEVVRGDDYFAADSRALTVEENATYNWPDLTGATVTFWISTDFTGHVWANCGTATHSGAPGAQVVNGLPTAIQTAALVEGQQQYQFRAALATSGHIVTLVTGQCKVIPGAS